MNIAGGAAWGIIPARGGSKSIQLKNLAVLGGRPLIRYVIEAGMSSGRLRRLVCSTDHPAIARVCEALGVEVLWRPEELSVDQTPVVDVLQHVLRTLEARDGHVAEYIAVLQPTSPFVLPTHLMACLGLLERDSRADSAQTSTTIPHNFHAFNQRVITDRYVRFRFPEERARGYSKQTKATHYIFGNLVVARSTTILEKRTVFGERSLPHLISPHYAMDVDGPDDLDMAEWLLTTGKVALKPALTASVVEQRR